MGITNEHLLARLHVLENAVVVLLANQLAREDFDAAHRFKVNFCKVLENSTSPEHLPKEIVFSEPQEHEVMNHGADYAEFLMTKLVEMEMNIRDKLEKEDPGT